MNEEAQATGAVESAEWQRVNPLSIIVQSLRFLAQAMIPIGFMLYSIVRDGDGKAGGLVFSLVGLGVLALMGLTVGIGWLGWYRLRYRIGESDVRVEQGILSRSARSVPYDRIQDVSLEQKLFPRLLGLVEVKFETGAGGKDELKLTYVAEAEGERLRESVRSLVEGAEPDTLPAGAGAGTDDALAPLAGSAIPARALFAMGPRRLFVYGLFSFSLVIFAVILGAAQQFDFLFNFSDWFDAWVEDERYTGARDVIAGYSNAAKITAALYALATVIVVGMASGVATVFVRDWGFLLERTAKGFRRRRGLLTKTDVVMPVHRVQALVVKTGLLRRRFGWHGLSFISLAQDSGKANHDVAPFAKLEEIVPIAGEAGFALPGGAVEWCRPSLNYYFVRGLAATLFLMIVIITAAVVVSLWWLVVIGVLLASLIALRHWYLWRIERHALDPAQVLSRRGWLAPRLQIASRAKLHSAGIRQGPLGRWLGYCDLHLGLAGGRMAFHGLRREDAYRMREAVLGSIAAVDFAKLPR